MAIPVYHGNFFLFSRANEIEIIKLALLLTFLCSSKDQELATGKVKSQDETEKIDDESDSEDELSTTWLRQRRTQVYLY